MPSRPGEIFAAGRSDHQPELETSGRGPGGICREIRESRRSERRLVEKKTSHPGRDWPDVEAAVGCEPADKLPGVPPMNATRNSGFRPDLSDMLPACRLVFR